VADGYTLRCDWSRMGTKEEMTFSELPPMAAKHGNQGEVTYEIPENQHGRCCGAGIDCRL
jgi:hypothetical protein